jgi:hypothetical protein
MITTVGFGSMDFNHNNGQLGASNRTRDKPRVDPCVRSACACACACAWAVRVSLRPNIKMGPGRPRQYLTEFGSCPIL